MREPVTLHLLIHIQGHHSDHWTEFVLTSEGGDPERSVDVISRVTYPGDPGVKRGFINSVAAEMDTVVDPPLTAHPPRGWVDHVSYNGYREVSEP